MHAQLFFCMKDAVFGRLNQTLHFVQRKRIIAHGFMRHPRLFEQFADFFGRRARSFNGQLRNEIRFFLVDTHA